MTYKQISAELNISVKTVESQMSRALKHMRKMLKAQGFFSLLIHI
jgi:RNA polymerase sigma-70 factor (ECF subfamily)